MKKNTKKTTKTTEKPKTVKRIDKLSQAHGKDEKFQPTTLDQIWGDDGLWKYSTTNEEVYIDELNLMTKIDIHTHATKIGLIPVDNRDTLEKRLLREFRRHTASYRRPLTQDTSITLSDEARQILEEGR
jgi:hypothetical protein